MAVRAQNEVYSCSPLRTESWEVEVGTVHSYLESCQEQLNRFKPRLHPQAPRSPAAAVGHSTLITADFVSDGVDHVADRRPGRESSVLSDCFREVSVLSVDAPSSPADGFMASQESVVSMLQVLKRVSGIYAASVLKRFRTDANTDIVSHTTHRKASTSVHPLHAGISSQSDFLTPLICPRPKLSTWRATTAVETRQ